MRRWSDELFSKFIILVLIAFCIFIFVGCGVEHDPKDNPAPPVIGAVPESPVQPDKPEGTEQEPTDTVVTKSVSGPVTTAQVQESSPEVEEPEEPEEVTEEAEQQYTQCVIIVNKHRKHKHRKHHRKRHKKRKHRKH